MADHQSHAAGRVCLHAEGRGTYKSRPAEGLHARLVGKHLKIKTATGSNHEFELQDVQYVCCFKWDCAKRKKYQNKTGWISTKAGGSVGSMPRKEQLNLGGDPGIFILTGLLGFC